MNEILVFMFQKPKHVTDWVGRSKETASYIFIVKTIFSLRSQ